MKSYKKPVLNVERFTANEFVAACGPTGVTYKFECNAGDEWGGYSVYLNGPDGEPHTHDDIFWCGGYGAVRGYRTYTKCGETHEAPDNNDFYPGYITKKKGLFGKDERNVIVWTANGTNTHCTTELDMSTWGTAKS